MQNYFFRIWFTQENNSDADSNFWIQGTVVGTACHNHSNRSCMIHSTKPGWLITRSNKHVKATLKTAEQYLWVKQKHSRHCRWHSKTISKVQIRKHDTYSQWMSKQRYIWEQYKWHTVKQHARQYQQEYQPKLESSEQWTERQPKLDAILQ